MSNIDEEGIYLVENLHVGFFLKEINCREEKNIFMVWFYDVVGIHS